MTGLRAGLPALPKGVAQLPVDARGYPVPWFVQWFAEPGGAPTEPGTGVPDFRVADGRKREAAVRRKLCWVCGQPLGKRFAFVVGPMCAVNRVSGDPPEHMACAEFSVRACPFLSLPTALRREARKPDGTAVPGYGIMRNPGVALVWLTDRYRVVEDGKGSYVLSMGAAQGVLWYAEGRPATRAEVEASFTSGLPILEAAAREDGPGALAQLTAQVAMARALLP